MTIETGNINNSDIKQIGNDTSIGYGIFIFYTLTTFGLGLFIGSII